MPVNNSKTVCIPYESTPRYIYNCVSRVINILVIVSSPQGDHQHMVLLFIYVRAVPIHDRPTNITIELIRPFFRLRL